MERDHNHALRKDDMNKHVLMSTLLLYLPRAFLWPQVRIVSKKGYSGKRELTRVTNNIGIL